MHISPQLLLVLAQSVYIPRTHESERHWTTFCVSVMGQIRSIILQIQCVTSFIRVLYSLQTGYILHFRWLFKEDRMGITCPCVKCIISLQMWAVSLQIQIDPLRFPVWSKRGVVYQHRDRWPNNSSVRPQNVNIFLQQKLLSSSWFI